MLEALEKREEPNLQIVESANKRFRVKIIKKTPACLSGTAVIYEVVEDKEWVVWVVPGVETFRRGYAISDDGQTLACTMLGQFSSLRILVYQKEEENFKVLMAYLQRGFITGSFFGRDIHFKDNDSFAIKIDKVNKTRHSPKDGTPLFRQHEILVQREGPRWICLNVTPMWEPVQEGIAQ